MEVEATNLLHERKHSQPSISVPYLQIFSNKYVLVQERCCPRCVLLIAGVVVVSVAVKEEKDTELQLQQSVSDKYVK